MTFRIPKGMTMVATGTKISDTTDGSHNVTVWKSELPMTVAGFNFGTFKREATRLEKPPMDVTSFANSDPPDWVNRVKSGSPGVGMYGSGPSTGTDLSSVLASMNTTVLNKKALGEAEGSLLVYSEYFGALPFRGLSMTQQTATNFGQSWPTLFIYP
jgi:hypothetical protein